MAIALIFLAAIGCYASRHPILGTLCLIVSALAAMGSGA